jgi:hypothetical protein
MYLTMVGAEGIEPNRQPLCNYMARDLQSPAENSPHIGAHQVFPY